MSAIYDVFYEKIDEALYENRRDPLILVGDYRNAYVIDRHGLSVLFDEFLEGDPEWLAMDVDENANYDTQFEQFVQAVNRGQTFGDYQQFRTFSSVLTQIRDDLMSADASEVPANEVYDKAHLTSDCEVRINGSRRCLIDVLSERNEPFGELCELLHELSNL